MTTRGANAMMEEGGSKQPARAHVVENAASSGDEEGGAPSAAAPAVRTSAAGAGPAENDALHQPPDAKAHSATNGTSAAAARAGWRGDDWTCLFLDRLKSDPDVAQIVATTGGLVTYWNDAFASVTRSSASLRHYPITVFELIESRSLGSFYGMLALALEGSPRAPSIVSEGVSGGGEDDEEEEEEEPSGPSHLSITLPCRRFRESDARYNITIVFMDDLSSRCFVGILTPMPPGPSPPRYIRIRTKKRRRVSSSDASCAGPSSEAENAKKDESADAIEPEEWIEEAEEARGCDERHRPRLPAGQMLRLYDGVLCRMIFGYD